MTSKLRLRKELQMLATEPPPGVSCWPVSEENMEHLQAQITGPAETPYAGGVFALDLQVSDRYPFEPPKVRFTTPIFHPNIDSGGRICLDTLKMPPAGSWTPSINVSTLLTTLRTLLAHPNGDDGLMPEITKLFKEDRVKFDAMAREHTLTNASSKSETRTKATAALATSTNTDKNAANKQIKQDAPTEQATEQKQTHIESKKYASSDSSSSDESDSEPEQRQQQQTSTKRDSEAASTSPAQSKKAKPS